MKKNLILYLSTFFLTSIMFISCKRDNTNKDIPEVQYLKTGDPLIGYVANNAATNRAPVAATIGNCNCNGHGGTIGGGISWHLSTCRSNCQRGIGFRCGRDGYLICQDGTTIICSSIVNCGNVAKGIDPDRDMSAIYTIYDNGTMKLSFNKAIPPIERETETGNIFDVETTDFLGFSSSLTVDNIIYTGVEVKQGKYLIDYSDGDFGSVVIAVELKQ